MQFHKSNLHKELPDDDAYGGDEFGEHVGKGEQIIPLPGKNFGICHLIHFLAFLLFWNLFEFLFWRSSAQPDTRILI